MGWGKTDRIACNAARAQNQRSDHVQEALMATRRLPTVREFMDRYAEPVSPETDIMEAVDFLLEKRVTGAPVANSKGELVGMLTEFDCLKLLTLGDERHD